MSAFLKCSNVAVVVTMCLSSLSLAAERPTFNVTCDPRPDILPHPIYDAHTEYRRQYNRPRYLTGWIAHKIAPTSQEAMVWCENYLAGRYDQKHLPAVCKRYYAPKPWEVLQTGARPDSVRPTRVPSRPADALQPSNPPPAPVPAPVEDEDTSPSDI